MISDAEDWGWRPGIEDIIVGNKQMGREGTGVVGVKEARERIVELMECVLAVMMGKREWTVMDCDKEIVFCWETYRWTENKDNKDAGGKFRSGNAKLVIKENVHKFSLLLSILKISLSNLSSGTLSLKRELFYLHENIANKQEEIDAIIQEMAYRLRLPRHSLGFVSSSKGLLSGHITVELLNINGQNNRERITLKPGLIETVWKPMGYSIVDTSLLQFVLVVEKESAFFDIIQEGFLSKYPGCLLVTARGYSDYNTKYFLRSLFESNNNIPYLYIGDYDPHGIDIYLNYAYSNRISFYENMDLPFLEYIGIDGEQLFEQLGKYYMPLSSEDMRKASQLLSLPQLSHPPVSVNPYPSTSISIHRSRCNRLRRSLSTMIVQGGKAEIEILARGDMLIDYLSNTIQALTGIIALQ